MSACLIRDVCVSFVRRGGQGLRMTRDESTMLVRHEQTSPTDNKPDPVFRLRLIPRMPNAMWMVACRGRTPIANSSRERNFT